jgi:xanthine dehydrogenase accessory factor
MIYSFPQLLERLAAAEGLALAVIVATGGSTPQVVGASALFSAAGLAAGTVGGGLLEAKVEAAAREALADLTPRLIAVRLDADPLDMEGAICGGEARVLVDPGAGRDREIFRKALEDCRRGRAGYLVTGIRLAEGGSVSTERAWLPFDGPWQLDKKGLAAEALDLEGAERLVSRYDPAGRLEYLTFIMEVRPLARLVIAGAGHVGRAVAHLGHRLDFSVTVVDDRPEFANAQNVPDADTIVLGDIGAALRTAGETAEDYFVIVTRGHQKDGEALRAVIGRPAAYIGMIGSRNKIEIMRREFLRNGWATEEDWARVRAPIGLDIGSRTVDEIAVSIAAELVLARSRRTAAGPV